MAGPPVLGRVVRGQRTGLSHGQGCQASRDIPAGNISQVRRILRGRVARLSEIHIPAGIFPR